ncbi:notochord granular surface [Xenentodon cancila]
MSRSPERMSSYRRCFDGSDAVVSAYRLRESSPSPTRMETRHRSASFNRSSKWKMMGHKTLTTKPHSTSSASMGALCLGVSTGLGMNPDLDAAAAENRSFKLIRTNERQELVVLNDRLAVYIEKVRTLESKNSLLEAETEALKSSYERTSGLRQLYASQLKELNRQAEQIREMRDLSLAAKEEKLGQLDMLKTQYDEVLGTRKQTEVDIETLRPDVDKSTSTRIKLEKQLENLEVELAFLQKVHKEEIEQLMQQIYSGASKTDLTFGLPDLSSALIQIQSQYESIAAKNLQELDVWYKSKLQDLNDASIKNAQAVRSLREEIANYRKEILNKECELESIKTRNEDLEAQMRAALKKYKEEEDLEEHKEAIKADLKQTKEKTALLMREYQDLLNAKMALEIEITTYRKLIEGEDSRLSTMVSNLCLTGGLLLTSSDLVGTNTVKASASDSSAVAETSELDGGLSDTGRSKVEKAPAASRVVAVSSNAKNDQNLQDQASEMSERKTVLMRTVKTDEGTYESNTQQCIITISAAAEDTDEE